jgi:RNA polymerase sigma-70 factor (ECF subfamily)
MAQASEILEQVFREEYGRIIATLIRQSGSFDLAEEALNEAFLSAASTWERDGPPRSPGAWLTTVAHRRLVDAIRRDKTRTETNLRDWIGERAQAGRLPPQGFPRGNKFT